MPTRMGSRIGSWTEEQVCDGPTIDGDRFVHPKRPAAFPPMYRLNEPHPLRPKGFTAKNYPRSKRDAFHDYVFLIKKEHGFMTGWQHAGQAQDTPCDDVETNQANGMSLHHVLAWG